MALISHGIKLSCIITWGGNPNLPLISGLLSDVVNLRRLQDGSIIIPSQQK